VPKFVQQLWNRKVFQFGALYLGAAWLLLQLGVVLEQTLELPNWVDQAVLTFLVLGFPLALILAWAQESKETLIAAEAEPDPAKKTPIQRPPDEKLSIAVLPFMNLSEERDHEFFADGMTEDLLTALSLNRHMSVAARTSSFKYKGALDDVRTIGEALNVGYIVEGSIRPMGERVRITAQLIETATGSHLWAEKYDRPLADLFDIQDEVLQAIIYALNANLSFGEGERLAAAKPASLSSWQRVQQLSTRMISGAMEDQREAISALKKVVEEEPDYAYATSLLAFSYLQRTVNGNSEDPMADYTKAVPLIDKGLALAPSDPQNLFYCASAAGYAGQNDRAIELAERALAINPNMFEINAPIAQAATNLGLFEKAEAALDRVQSVKQSHWQMGVVWYRAILRCTELRYEDAMPLLKQTIQAMPKYIYPRILLAIAQDALGDRDAALKTIKQAHAIAPDLDMRGMKATLRAYKYPKEGEAERRITLLKAFWQEAAEA